MCSKFHVKTCPPNYVFNDLILPSTDATIQPMFPVAKNRSSTLMVLTQLLLVKRMRRRKTNPNGKKKKLGFKQLLVIILHLRSY